MAIKWLTYCFSLVCLFCCFKSSVASVQRENEKSQIVGGVCFLVYEQNCWLPFKCDIRSKPIIKARVQCAYTIQNLFLDLLQLNVKLNGFESHEGLKFEVEILTRRLYESMLNKYFYSLSRLPFLQKFIFPSSSSLPGKTFEFVFCVFTIQKIICIRDKDFLF